MIVNESDEILQSSYGALSHRATNFDSLETGIVFDTYFTYQQLLFANFHAKYLFILGQF
ncbi:hypothetical protein T11_14615 [Trichinella zimbabwensis]|uniref:Uncharacterized protein n=1 Tax=Trichinella zimbabwensis TaxID=268475 RepID=A0A0V1EPQ6_9BILA|nr:hypothetical protein T11_14615 [Trichinella zimbabwensis]